MLQKYAALSCVFGLAFAAAVTVSKAAFLLS
eukprot:CAMPEP_0198604138 /NCGR_PEP_ID=MMETSP1462-20131121/152810_1 /TAXON_ID=1333877 /ORGANISM="Brandtodinium nutriculum, Strain RCC3387" /LENGTH=30 /DNA_ID= /DNA_START= /DNA_END= /DNA_ORIENTATION=